MKKPQLSPRLSRFLALLKKGEFSTLEVVFRAEVLAVNSCASDLRRKGYNVRCVRRNGKYYYSLGKKGGKK